MALKPPSNSLIYSGSLAPGSQVKFFSKSHLSFLSWVLTITASLSKILHPTEHAILPQLEAGKAIICIQFFHEKSLRLYLSSAEVIAKTMEYKKH